MQVSPCPHACHSRDCRWYRARPEPGGGSLYPFGTTDGTGCTGRPSLGDGDVLGGDSGAGLAVGDGSGGVGVQFGTVGTWIVQALRATTRNRPGRPYAHRARWSERAITPRAYVDGDDPAGRCPVGLDRTSYARRAPQTAAREHGLTCPVALIRSTTESVGTE